MQWIDYAIFIFLAAVIIGWIYWDRKLAWRDREITYWWKYETGPERSNEYTGLCPQCGGATYGYHCQNCTPKSA